MTAPASPTPASPTPAPPGPAPALSYRRCSAGYAGTAVVHDVDLDVARGECVALLGPNGSGKTTLVRATLGLAEVVSGELDVLGAPVRPSRPRAGRRVGYVPQRHTVATSVPATVEEVVEVGRLAGTGPLRALVPARRRADRLAVRSALEAVGLGERGRSSVSELSGGQQRRVLIARALASEPEVLVLDEPTAGVDEESQHSLVEVLAGLSRSGVTMVIVTHELAAVQGLVERSVRLVSGRVRSDVRHPVDPALRGVHPPHPESDHPADHHADERDDVHGAAARPGQVLGHPHLGV